MAENSDVHDYAANPLDLVEDALTHQDWTFDRPNPQQLTLNISGRYGAYSLNFFWQEDLHAMQILCAIDMTVPEPQQGLAARALMTLNARLPVGHFTLQDAVPCYRYTVLLRNASQFAASEYFEDMVDVAIGECDRAYAIFDIIINSNEWSPMLDLAIAETAGEA